MFRAISYIFIDNAHLPLKLYSNINYYLSKYCIAGTKTIIPFDKSASISFMTHSTNKILMIIIRAEMNMKSRVPMF